MKTTKLVRSITLLSTAALLGFGAIGCDSTTTCADGGVCPDGGAGGKGGSAGGSTGAGGAGAAGGAGGQLFALTPGNYCFEILSIAPGYVDGCAFGVETLVSTPAAPSALPVTYYNVATTVGTDVFPAGTVEVGNSGSLGRGVIAANKATLLRDGTSMLPSPEQACSWHDMATTAFELTAENTFNVGVTRTKNMFSAACATSSAPPPAAGTCTSTWTWTMKIMIPQTLMAPTCQ